DTTRQAGYIRKASPSYLMGDYMRRAISVMAFGILLGAVPSVSAAPYTFLPIEFPGSTLTVAFDIKNSRTIIGAYGCSVGPLGDNPLQLAHWSCTTLANVPGADATNATGTNPEGDIAGLHISGGGQHGFLRSRSGVFSSIDVPGATLTQVWGINALRQI